VITHIQVVEVGKLFSSTEFWQLWEEYQDYLYRCCLKWMGKNSTDAEDALSRAKLKAWEKVQNYAVKIVNIKAWLTRLTHNICVDIYREHSRNAKTLENIELYASDEQQGVVFFDNTPEKALETNEKKIVIRQAINSLPSRLHKTFILHFYQELSYQEIAQQQNISYQNVCKRISQARAILREDLRGYFIGQHETPTKLSNQPSLSTKESAIGEIYQANIGVESIDSETRTLSEEAEEVEIGINKLQQELGLSEQQRDSTAVGATSKQKLELKKDYCQWEEMRLFDTKLTTYNLHLVKSLLYVRAACRRQTLRECSNSKFKIQKRSYFQGACHPPPSLYSITQESGFQSNLA
jgi:RNA polymerase sigma factor (sigma-70 family)